MLPKIEAIQELIKFTGALSIVTGAMAWFHRGSADEDKVVVEANSIVLEAVSNADTVGKIDTHSGKNIRDQLTVEQAMEMNREKELRGFGWRRN